MRDTKTDISSFTTLFDMKSRKGTYAMERLFLIEDDGKIARNLILLLRGEGFTVSHAATCADALAMLSGSTFDIKALVHGMRLQPESSRAERLESGRRVLMNYLKARGITDSIVQQEICDLITKEQPYMLENLYMADFCGSEDTGRAYDLVMECYTGCKTEMTLMEYLEKYGVTDPAEQQEIYGMLLEKQPSMLQDQYRAVKQGSGDADEPEGL